MAPKKASTPNKRARGQDAEDVSDAKVDVEDTTGTAAAAAATATDDAKLDNAEAGKSEDGKTEGAENDNKWASTVPVEDSEKVSAKDMNKPVEGFPSFYNNYGNTTLCSKDFEATKDFYVNKLGWKCAYQFQTFWLEIRGPAVRLGFEPPHGEPAIAPGGFSIGCGVSDLDAAIEHLKKAGVTVSEKSTEGPVTLVTVTDPDGNQIKLIGDAA